MGVIYWGFDEDDFKNIQPTSDGYFNMVHTGLLGFDRCPDTLFKVLLELINENQEFDFVFVDAVNVLDKAVFEGRTMIAHAIPAP